MSEIGAQAYVDRTAMLVESDGGARARRAARAAARSRPLLRARPLLFAYGVNGAVGTLGPAWLYLVPGISWVDLAIAINFLVLVARGRGLRMPRRQALMSMFVAALAVWLIVATAVNAYWFTTYLADVLPALKLLYFLVLLQVIRIQAARFGARDLVYGFLVGTLAMVLVDLQSATIRVVGIPVLTNTNVLGALLALGIVFATISIAFRNGTIVNLAMALACLGLSITTFSKGTWLMCLFAVVALLAVLSVRRPVHKRARRMRRRAAALTVVAMLGAAAFVVTRNLDRLSELVNFKLESTSEQGTFVLRQRLIQASLRAGIDYPLFGLGYRNFQEVTQLYPDLQLPILTRADNAHNLLAQTLAVGGVPAVMFLVLSVFTGLSGVPVALAQQMRRYRSRTLAVSMIAAIWLLYASVQLELIAQPPFWIFCGMMFGLSQQRPAGATVRRAAAEGQE